MQHFIIEWFVFLIQRNSMNGACYVKPMLEITKLLFAFVSLKMTTSLCWLKWSLSRNRNIPGICMLHCCLCSPTIRGIDKSSTNLRHYGGKIPHDCWLNNWQGVPKVSVDELHTSSRLATRLGGILVHHPKLGTALWQCGFRIAR